MSRDDFKLTDEQEELAEKLTHLQRMTIINLVGGMDRVEAHRAAGGKAKTDKAASNIVGRMLDDVGVKAFYDSLVNSSASNSVMTREEALERLTRAARVTVLDIAEFADKQVGEDEDGNPVVQTVWQIKNSENMSPEAAAAIKSITATRMGPKLELHDPLSAIKQLADMQGWEAPKKIEGDFVVSEIRRRIVDTEPGEA